MKEKLVEIMLGYIDTCATYCVTTSDVEEAAEEISKLFPHWVPVSERLPEDYKEVLVLDESGDRWIGYYSPKDGHFINNSNYRTLWRITHWQNLPELPK